MVRPRPRELVLVGGGHTHVQVLRRFAMAPPPSTRITVVLDTPIAVYSGMVPGFVAGAYRADELAIDVVPLARRARARLVLAAATRVEPEERLIHLAGRPPLRYDLASLDVGSTVAGLALPGIAEHAMPTRPIGRFVRRVETLVARGRAHGDAPFRLLVVGGGAGGVEVAFALARRLRTEGVADPRVTLVHDRPRVLPGYPEGLATRVAAAAKRAGIALVEGRRVIAAEAARVRFDDGGEHPCDALVWVTGAAATALLEASPLPRDPRGFAWTRATLQVEGHDQLFAVGDCGVLRDHPETPKAGVYAVRQGPCLIANLRAMLTGGRLRRYRPQRDFLTLLNLGDGTALGAKWGLAFGGPWTMRWKDWIDRRFMRRFQVLDADGDLADAFRRPAMEREMGAMLCGGCAAKVGQRVLTRALERLPPAAGDASVERGLAHGDDAAAVRTPGGDLLVSSIDAFRAFTDDPWLVGRVAAVNAVSDLLAKGVAPRYAQALVALPEEAGAEEAEEILVQVLSGARAAFDPLAVTVLGGHTMTAAALTVGFAVEGFAGRPLLKIEGLRPGQALVLTKALGTGVLFHADMQGRARGPWLRAAIDAMCRPNAEAARILVEAGSSAATDVTGFGLAGHLGEMLRAAGLAAELALDALPALPGAEALLARGLRSTFHAENARARRGLWIAPAAAADPRLELLFDPQTAGGLLAGLPTAAAADAVRRLHQAGDAAAAVIGRVCPPRADGAPIAVLDRSP